MYINVSFFAERSIKWQGKIIFTVSILIRAVVQWFVQTLQTFIWLLHKLQSSFSFQLLMSINLPNCIELCMLYPEVVNCPNAILHLVTSETLPDTDKRKFIQHYLRVVLCIRVYMHGRMTLPLNQNFLSNLLRSKTPHPTVLCSLVDFAAPAIIRLQY